MPAGRKNTSRGHFWRYGVRGSARAAFPILQRRRAVRPAETFTIMARARKPRFRRDLGDGALRSEQQFHALCQAVLDEIGKRRPVHVFAEQIDAPAPAYAARARSESATPCCTTTTSPSTSIKFTRNTTIRRAAADPQRRALFPFSLFALSAPRKSGRARP